MLPRERDVQQNVVIVDNDLANSGFSEVNGDSTWKSSQSRYLLILRSHIHRERILLPWDSQSHIIRQKGRECAGVKYYPTIPERGEYAVYVSYQSFPKSMKGQYILFITKAVILNFCKSKDGWRYMDLSRHISI